MLTSMIIIHAVSLTGVIVTKKAQLFTFETEIVHQVFPFNAV